MKHRGLWSCWVLPRGMKDWRCNMCMWHVYFQHFLFAPLVPFYLFSHSEWKSGGQDRAGGMYSPDLFFFFSPSFSPDQDFWVSLEDKTYGSGSLCSRISGVMSGPCIWWMPIWHCGFYSELLCGSNLLSEIFFLSVSKINWAKKRNFAS